MKVIAGSENPSKIKAVQLAFEKLFPGEELKVTGASVSSGVSDQPFGDDETLTGAMNRTRACFGVQADFYVGLEGGCTWQSNILEAFAWMVVSDGQRFGKARTASFQLPGAVADLVRNGMELGHADDQVFRRQNSKQGNGAVGILTNDIVDRATYYEQAIILAAVPFLHPDLY